jgi:predicted ribosomally synthesized peptide with SipW-like signal peptide
MFTIIKKRGVALVASVALLGGAAWLAAGSTGAYFSDTKTGSVSGNIGSIHVTTWGGGGTSGNDLTFTNMLPGALQTVTINYTNTGANAQDLYIVFPNATALSALNDLGHYGEAHLSANGTALFDSSNLSDHTDSCGPLSPSGCWPLKSQYLAASNVAPGQSGSVSFSFAYGPKLQSQPAVGSTAPWNSYPVPTQFTTKASDGTGAGLPYEIVATQPGITPGS